MLKYFFYLIILVHKPWPFSDRVLHDDTVGDLTPLLKIAFQAICVMQLHIKPETSNKFLAFKQILSP